MANMIKICPQCGHVDVSGGDACAKCAAEMKTTQYSELYWGKCSEERKSEIVKQYVVDKKAAAEAQAAAEKKAIEQKKLQEERDRRVAIETERYKNTASEVSMFHVDGARGRSIDIYPYKCVISVAVTVGSVLTNNATDGEKTIYFQDCIGLQCKPPRLTLGYIQFETASGLANNEKSNFFNENTFTFEQSQLSDADYDRIVAYVKSRIETIKMMQLSSPADEIKKYKALLDDGAITAEEYEKKKEQLLAL